MLKIIIAEPNRLMQRKAIERLRAVDGVLVKSVCADLTGAFDEVEHSPPDLLLVSPELSRLPEFETMNMLLRMLKVNWIPLLDSAVPSEATGHQSRPVFDLSAPGSKDMLVLERATGKQSDTVTVAKSGLLRAMKDGSDHNIILIGSSTGGVDALLLVLGSFPQDCPPTLIVQHTGSGFSAGLARLLDRHVAPQVREAGPNDRPAPGLVLLAPGNAAHLTLDTRHGLRCRLDPADPVSGHRPSVDALFRSAVPVAERVTAAILTGMGKDGAEGLLALRKAGAMTIGQDQETSVVYGMPRHAAEIGAVKQTLPISSIGPALLKTYSPMRKSA